MPTKIMCLPYAGAGASVFRPWQDYPSETIEVVPVQLPGREELFLDELHPDMPAAAADAAARILKLADGGPFALFGHSFGGILAFECAHRLVAAGVPPTHLVVSGTYNPAVVGSRVSVRGRTDDELTAGLADMIGYKHESLDNADLRELLLPILRADLGLIEDYRPADRDPLPLPITVLHGVRDIFVPHAECAEWGKWTSAAFAVRDLDGGHMYFVENWPLLWRAIEDAL